MRSATRVNVKLTLKYVAKCSVIARIGALSVNTHVIWFWCGKKKNVCTFFKNQPNTFWRESGNNRHKEAFKMLVPWMSWFHVGFKALSLLSETSMQESWLHPLHSCSMFVTESIVETEALIALQSITRLPRAQEKAEQMITVTISDSDSVSQQSI